MLQVLVEAKRLAGRYATTGSVFLAMVLAMALHAVPARAQHDACGPKAREVVSEAGALVGKAVPCARIAKMAATLKTLGKSCAGRAVNDLAATRAATLRFQLLAQVCVTGTPGATKKSATPRSPGPPRTPTGPTYLSDELVKEAGEHVEDLRRRIMAERTKCPAEGACPAIEPLEKEQVEATIAFLQLTTRQERGFGDARRLLVGALASDPHDLLGAIARLQTHSLDPSTAATVASDMLAALATSAKDPAIFREKFDELFASISAEGAGGVERASKLLTALQKKGISTSEAQELLVRIASMPRAPGRTLDDSFRLAAFVNDPEVLRQWKASLDWLFGKGGTAPPELRQALAREQPDPHALIDIINRMNEEQAKALVDYAAVVAHREEELRRQAITPKTPRNSYIIFSGGGPEGDPCSAQHGFRSALEEFLTQASPVGIRQPVVVSEEDPKKLEEIIAEALCMCRHQKSCAGTTVPAIDGRCEGVLAVRFKAVEDGMQAMGSLRFVAAAADEEGRLFQVSEHESPRFSSGCDEAVRSKQTGAAIALIRDLQRRAVVFELFPRVASTTAKSQERPSRWNALVLSGLPQLRDSNGHNDRLGWALAGIDLALAGCAAMSGALAYQWRNDYADGNRSSLDAANAALVVTTGCVLGLAAERLIAVLTY